MPKLLEKEKFLDVSDYGRKPAIFLAHKVKKTWVTPVHITYLFGIVGLVAIYSIVSKWYILGGILLIVKSILDAMDGELARLNETPSYTGRYLDSIFDSVLNFILIVTIGYLAQWPLWLNTIAFLCIQLQCTLYNYYYVIQRHRSDGGDTTSKIFEMRPPIALPGEKQKTVNRLFTLYMVLYSAFDKTIYQLDNSAYKVRSFPNWFMTLLSFYGLGFQLLIIAFFLSVDQIEIIIPFFIAYSLPIAIIIGIRKLCLQPE